MPVVWNTGGYERVETLRSLEGKVQIWLPDLKYADSALAQRYSGAADYFPVATAAIEEMYRQVGDYVLKDGLLRRGVVIRHLLLPGALDNAKAVMDWVAEHFRPGQVLFSLMSQSPLSRERRACCAAGSPGRSTVPPSSTWKTWALWTATARTPPPPRRSTPTL